MWRFLKNFSGGRETKRLVRRASLALPLNHRGEVRMDGLTLKSLQTRVEIEWGGAGRPSVGSRCDPRAGATSLSPDQCLDDAEPPCIGYSRESQR